MMHQTAEWRSSNIDAAGLDNATQQHKLRLSTFMTFNVQLTLMQRIFLKIFEAAVASGTGMFELSSGLS